LFNVFEGNIEGFVGKRIVTRIDAKHLPASLSTHGLQSRLDILKCLMDVFVKVIIKIALRVAVWEL